MSPNVKSATDAGAYRFGMGLDNWHQYVHVWYMEEQESYNNP
ncbi:hypothetical protein XM38_033680 [Halomicronema hongdechloris C2206]|uniref:Uncharacterized protein n=1 Tax=Halomicronema hongdechloris C2206 TaxID=1641165 RepID=A0A1Z3HQ22_9CYAN|nr:hypothetical protein XM38_033680 [Halomicronema hongdechloris C2206]